MGVLKQAETALLYAVLRPQFLSFRIVRIAVLQLFSGGYYGL